MDVLDWIDEGDGFWRTSDDLVAVFPFYAVEPVRYRLHYHGGIAGVFDTVELAKLEAERRAKAAQP